MRVVNARGKLRSDFPPVEFCCESAAGLQREFHGVKLKVDLDDTVPYTRVGHCRQKLPYKLGVMVVDAPGDIESWGYVPFELIDIERPPCNPRDAANHPDCVTCQSSDGPVPYHDGSKNCQSGSISSWGANSHCTCDTCF